MTTPPTDWMNDLPTEAEFDHEKRLSYIVRFEAHVREMGLFKSQFEKMASENRDANARIESKVDNLSLEITTYKKVAKAFVAISAGIGALVTFILTAYSHFKSGIYQ